MALGPVGLSCEGGLSESAPDAVPADRHCYGEVLRVRRVGQLTLTETEHNSTANTPTHAHESSSFCVVLQGGFVDVVGATRRCSAVGSVLFQPRGAPHSRQFVGRLSRCLTVDLGPQLSACLEGRGLRAPDATAVAEPRTSWLAARLYEEFRRVDAESGLAIEGLSLATLAHLTRAAGPGVPADRTPPWLPAVLDLLDEGYLAPIRLADLAARVGVQPGCMLRTFRRCIGVTLTDYVRQRRIDWASHRLMTTEFPLSRIAMEAGFTDQAHFARLFKRATGLTPRAFRAERAAADRLP
jgi:AraC-like DNA-binding protein